MKKIDLYILKHIAAPSAMTLLVVSFLAIASRVRQHYDDMPAEVLGLMDFARLFLYFLPALIVFILPITLLVGVIWSMSQLAQNDELTAIKAGGVSLRRLSMPILISGAALSVLCFWIQNVMQPWGMERATELIYMEVHKRLTLDVLPAGEMHEDKGMRVYFRDKNTDDHTLLDIDIYIPNGDDTTMYHAESANLSYDDGQYRLRLMNGHLINSIENFTGIFTFESTTISIPPPSTTRDTGVSQYSMTISELYTNSKKLREEFAAAPAQKTKNDLIGMQEELSKRLSMPFSAVAIAFISAPLALRSRRKGKTDGFFYGVLVLGVYFILLNVIEPQSLNPLHEVILRAWIPNVVLLTAGTFLLIRVDRI